MPYQLLFFLNSKNTVEKVSTGCNTRIENKNGIQVRLIKPVLPATVYHLSNKTLGGMPLFENKSTVSGCDAAWREAELPLIILL